MKKFLLLIVLIPCFVQAQQTYFTPGIPPSSLSFTPTFRFKNGSVDSLNNIYLAIGNKSYQVYTAAQANARFTGGGGTSTGINGLNGTANIGLGGTLGVNTYIHNGGFSLSMDSVTFGSSPTLRTRINNAAVAVEGASGFGTMLFNKLQFGSGATNYFQIQGGASINTITGNPITITPKVSFAVNPALGATSTVGYVPTATNTSGDWSWAAPAAAPTTIYSGDGSLASDRNVDINGHTLSFGINNQNIIIQEGSTGFVDMFSGNGGSTGADINTNYNGTVSMTGHTGSANGNVKTTPSQVLLDYTNSSAKHQTFTIQPSGAIFTDNISKKDIAAAANYGANLSSLSYITKHEADSLYTGGGAVTAVTGTTNRITSTGGTTPQIDISASYAGQTSITILGTIATGSIPYSLITGTPSLTGYVPYTGATGNVNLGTNFIAAGASLTPLVPVHAISTISTNPRGILSDQNTADAVGARITMRKSRGTPASPSGITTGDVLGSWTAAGYTNAYTDAGKVLVTSTGTISNGIVPSIMELQTMNAAGTLTDGIKIDQAQQLTFGGYSTTGLAHLIGGALTSSLLVNADITAGTITNASLANSSTTINGTSIALGASGTVTAAAGTLTGSTLNSSITASSLTSFGSSPTLNTAVLTGLPTGTGVSNTSSASTLAARDANSNLYANAFHPNFTTTVSSATPIVLTVGSTQVQEITGSTAQTVTLPVASTLTTGWTVIITSASSATITVQSSGGNTVATLVNGNTATIWCVLASGTGLASWDRSLGSGSFTGTGGSMVLATGASLTSPTITTGTFSGNQAGSFNFSGSIGVIGRLTTVSGIVQKVVNTAINTSATVTAAQLAGGGLTSTSAALVTMTLPTATSIGSTISATQGTQFYFVVDNTAGANIVTVAVGSGMTAVSAITGGTLLTVTNGQSGTFLLVFSSATVCQISRVQ